MARWVKGNYIIFILLAIGLSFFAYYIHDAVRWLLYSGSIDFGEGFIMKYAELWANGTWDWDITTPPYLTMVYGLGYPIIMQPFINAFGAGVQVGRAVSFVSALVVCFLLYLIVTKLTGKKIYGLLAGLLPATQPIFRDWSVMARVDMSAVMFDILGLYLVIKFKDRKWVYVAVIPFIIAMMIKLTAVAGLVAVIIYLIIVNKKRAFIFSSLMAVCIVGLLAIFMAVSHDQYLNHLILYQNTIQNFDIPIFMVNWQMFFYAFIPLFILSLLYLKRYLGKHHITIIALFFIVAFTTNAIGTFRPGAAGMYYYETIIAGVICSVLVYHYLIRKRRLQIANVMIVALVGFLVLYGVRSTMAFPEEQYDVDSQAVERIIQDTDKPVITENPVLVENAGKAIYIEPFIFSNLARLGYWDDSDYVKQYQKQYFDYVLLKVSLSQKIKNVDEYGYIDGMFTRKTLEAIKNNYTLVYSNEKSDTYTNPNEDWRCALNLYEANRRLER